MDILRQIEAKWQKIWDKERVFEADPDPNRRKCFVTFPYSYANGPLHVGHAFTAARVDVYARFKRMQGFNVLFPWAWHWTGTTITGASKRVRLGDHDLLRALREVDKVSEEDLKKFADPVFMASYYTGENRNTARQAGFSIDWRREFHTTAPIFTKFIEWQYTKLRGEGYVEKGTHPVVWCPQCKSPTGDHDRQEGIGVAVEEYTLVKFGVEDCYLPAATFRPETLFGVTNIWVHPDADYVEAKVNGEKWIISDSAAAKLKKQKQRVTTIRRFKGKELIGKHAVTPILEKQVPVLPAVFVNANHATGVVYSVPAHAPVDWLALRDLQTSLKPDDTASKLSEEVKPISMIRVPDFGEYPALEVVDQLGVKDQCDPKAEEATQLLYKKEFHNGVLKKNCGKYAGRKVQEVKDKLIQDFKKQNVADSMYDLPQPVMCRCMTPCIVKVLKEQWFLKYGDPKWKNKAQEALDHAVVRPETASNWFQSTIEWLRDKPCARKSGLGTPLPWNREWIIETLSDSTIYMAFYTIVNHIRRHEISSEQLRPEVFEYIFYGENSQQEVAAKSRINPQVLQSMRSEFEYWYPVDMRNSAKELIPNHLTFFLYHHAALFARERWPRMIGANGMLMIEGKKMSKSKGNFVTFRNAIKTYGADATRCALLLAAEGMDDPDWRSENVQEAHAKLESFYRLANTIVGKANHAEKTRLETWLLSIMQHRIETVTESIEMLKTRTAAETALFDVWNDFRWYIRRKGGVKDGSLLEALSIWVRLLTPFTPHICEEIWSRMKKPGLASLATWPEFTTEKVDARAEEAEALIKATLEDTLSIIRATKIKPERVFYYTSTLWKWEVYKMALSMSTEKHQVSQGDLMRELMKNPKLKRVAKQIQKFTALIIEEVNRMGPERRKRLLSVNRLNEPSVLKEAKEFLELELNVQVKVYVEDDDQRHDPRRRAETAKPYRPAIYME